MKVPDYKMDCFSESTNEVLNFILREQLLDKELWNLFVVQFSNDSDNEDLGWRGEYWGKMMRGACMILEHTENPPLYKILEESVKDLLKKQDFEGRISTYNKKNEFSGWDMWCRKYVSVGLEYFLKICKDPVLAKNIVESLKLHCNYIMLHVGREEGMIRITDTSEIWGGLNSSSILKSFVVLYELTGENRYLEYAEYIISEGGSKGFDIFEAAFESKIMPYEYPYKKAYEMISCFEGLLEYYKVTNSKKYLDCCVRFADAVIKTDMTVVGGVSCYHEIFNHSEWMQTIPIEMCMQETCVTVSLMILFNELYNITRKTHYLDRIENMYFNLYEGTLRKKKDNQPNSVLPFYSYSPLINNQRAKGIGGKKYISANRFYGCCAAIGSAGIGTFLGATMQMHDQKLYLNFMINGNYHFETDNQKVSFSVLTDYPKTGKVQIRIDKDFPKSTEICLRAPDWNKKARLSFDNKGIAFSKEEDYLVFEKQWQKGDMIEVDFEMPIKIEKRVNPNNNDQYFCIKRGPIVYAADAGYCKPNEIWQGDPELYGVVEHDAESERGNMIEMKDTLGRSFLLINYASAGKVRPESAVSCWLRYTDA